jgi:hypothetical protein
MDKESKDILCVAHNCNQCRERIEECGRDCPVVKIKRGPSLLCQGCLNMYEEEDPDGLPDDAPGDLYKDMASFMEDFKVARHYAPEPFPVDTGEIFAKINDAIKLAHFMRKDNDACYKKFSANYQASLFVKGSVCKELLDKAIREMAEGWYRDEMLAWSFGEKDMFVNYISKLKAYRILKENHFAERIQWEHDRAEVLSGMNKRKAEGMKLKEEKKHTRL